MAAEVWCYSLLYWLFALIVLYPPDEVVSAGLTIEALLGSWLGSQLSGFIQYHVRRTAATLIVHSLLLPGKISTIFNLHLYIFVSDLCIFQCKLSNFVNHVLFISLF